VIPMATTNHALRLSLLLSCASLWSCRPHTSTVTRINFLLPADVYGWFIALPGHLSTATKEVTVNVPMSGKCEDLPLADGFVFGSAKDARGRPILLEQAFSGIPMTGKADEIRLYCPQTSYGASAVFFVGTPAELARGWRKGIHPGLHHRRGR
jgi:hypothetical protein